MVPGVSRVKAGDFYKKFGFVETGDNIDDEIVAELKL